MAQTYTQDQIFYYIDHSSNIFIRPLLKDYYHYLLDHGYTSLQNYLYAINAFIEKNSITSWNQLTLQKIEDHSKRYSKTKHTIRKIDRFIDFLFSKDLISEDTYHTILKRKDLKRISNLESKIHIKGKKTPEQYMREGSKDYYKTIFIEFIHWKRRLGSEESTIFDYCYKLREFLDLQESFDDYNDTTIQVFIGSKNNKNKRMRYFRYFGKFLKQSQFITKKQLKKIRQLKFKENKTKNKKFAIPYNRWDELLSLFTDSIARKFTVWLSIHYALRLGEIAHLQTTYFFLDVEKPFFKIEPDPLQKWHPKTFNSSREIPIAKQHIAIIKSYFKERAAYLAKCGKKHDYVVFSNWVRDRGNYITTHGIKKWFEKTYLEFPENGKLTKKHISHHMLRYSGAYKMYDQTKNIVAVQKLLGHWSPKQTMDYLNLHESTAFDVKHQAINETY